LKFSSPCDGFYKRLYEEEKKKKEEKKKVDVDDQDQLVTSATDRTNRIPSVLTLSRKSANYWAEPKRRRRKNLWSPLWSAVGT
jgi:hypothetical protein